MENIQFTAYHGVLAEERKEGNTFLVSVRLAVPETAGVQTDRIEDTADYRPIYQIIAAEMAQPSNLLEHVVGRIHNALKKQYPQARVEVTVKKKNPPVGAPVEWASVTIQ